MEVITGMLGHVTRHVEEEDIGLPARHGDRSDIRKNRRYVEGVYKGALKLTLEDIPFSAYMVNFDFEIEWINQDAEEKIINQKVGQIENGEARNIFRLLFKWEFHSQIQNWKDIIAFHMSFAKLKFSRAWLSRLYRGISDQEIRLLEEIYDETSVDAIPAIQDRDISLLRRNGSIDGYRVYSIFFTEGILFIYKARE